MPFNQYLSLSLSIFLSSLSLFSLSLSLSHSHSHSHNLAVFYSHIFLISSIHLSLFPFSSDLLFKATDLEGIVVVTIPSAKRLREPVTWFNGTYVFPLTQLSLHPARFLFLFLWLLSLSLHLFIAFIWFPFPSFFQILPDSDPESGSNTTVQKRSIIKYDSKAAAAAHAKIQGCVRFL